MGRSPDPANPAPSDDAGACSRDLGASSDSPTAPERPHRDEEDNSFRCLFPSKN